MKSFALSMIFAVLSVVGCGDIDNVTDNQQKLTDGQEIIVDFPAVVNTEGHGCSAGQQCAFTVRLAVQPETNVAVPIAKSPTGKTLSFPSPVGFTPTNYSTPQNVLTLGLQDADAIDENVTLTLGPSSDGAPAVNVYVIIIDDEHP